MSRPIPSAGPSLALDAARAAAALLVLLSHARDMLVRDAAATPAMPPPARAVMAASGLGHQAVIVFFVLSGYLVTAAMLRLDAARRWSLPAFAVARLTRLWVVLIPCLVLGGSLDAIGLALRGGTASVLPYGIPPLSSPVAAPALGAGVALGNLLFLQTIAVPVFGSNGALWSLANEAWYYVLAGLLFAAWRRRGTPASAALSLAAAAIVACALPRSVLELAPVWAFGAAIAVAPGARRRGAGPAMVAALAFAGMLLASRLRLGPNLLVLDLLMGGGTALLVRHLVALPNPAPTRAGVMVRRISGLSYSLYLSHCPVLALFSAVAIGSRRLPLGLAAGGLMAIGMAVALAVAGALWWAFERHTGRIRQALLQAWVGRPAAPGLDAVAQGTTS